MLGGKLFLKRSGSHSSPTLSLAGDAPGEVGTPGRSPDQVRPGWSPTWGRPSRLVDADAHVSRAR